MQALLLAATCLAACPDTTAATGGRETRPPLDVEISHTRETLTGGRAEWSETAVRITHRDGARHIWLQGRHLNRFGRDDGDLTLGTAFPLAPDWTVHADAGFSPRPVFLPDFTVGGLLMHGLPGGWTLGYGLRYLEYPTAPVFIQQGHVDHYFSRFGVGYTLTHTDVRGGGSGFGHTGRGSMFYGLGSVVSVGTGFGRGVETVAPEDVRLLEIHSVVLWGVHWLDGGTGLTYTVGWHRHGDVFERSGVALGVRQRL